MDLLLYFPIRLIVFKSKVCGDSIKLEERIKFIAEYTYPIYKNIVSTYLNKFNKPDYNENKKYKPAQKGDILEGKVINTIKSGYFKDFTPDYFIEVDSIINLNKKLEDREKIINLNDYILIMITQSNTYGKNILLLSCRN